MYCTTYSQAGARSLYLWDVDRDGEIDTFEVTDNTDFDDEELYLESKYHHVY